MKKVFVSYSHVDEKYHEEFLKHIKVMELNKEIEVWSDVKLHAGEEITPNILRKLYESNVVIFLISVDFFNSKFIMDREVAETLRNKENKTILPIILRACDWKSTDLVKYLAVPKDGKPIELIEGNRDEVWLKIVESIRESIKDSKAVSPKAENYELHSDFKYELNKNEVNFFHKNKENLNLDDVFVYPHLKKIDEEDRVDKIELTIDSGQLKGKIGNDNKILIIGEEQSGKTSLAKVLFLKYLSDGFLPVLLNGLEIKESDADKNIKNALDKQYQNLTLSDYYESRKNKIVIIDDFHLTKLNKKFQKIYLENIEKRIGLILVFGDKMVQYNEKEHLIFSAYKQYEILAFGHVKRAELIEKWNSVGETETISEEKLEALVDNTTRNIDDIIRGNIVPPKPLYVLTIIQSLEVNKSGDYSLTSYGHCYQSLILFALTKQKITHKEFDGYFNYLRELAFSIFKGSKIDLGEEEIKSFETNYSKDYLIESHKKTQEVLLAANILEKKNGKISFRYKYLFYFFVAKHIAEKNDHLDCKGILEGLCKNIHTEMNANIVIFLVHHTKDRKVIDEILLNTMYVFDGVEEENLNVSDLKILNGLFDALPKLILEQRSIEAERVKDLQNKDRLDEVKKEQENETKEDDRNIFSDIVKSARAVEIIGQILRNYHGSLSKEDLKSLSTQGIKVGLRFLRFYLNILEGSKEYIFELLNNFIKNNSEMGDEEVLKESKKMFLTLCHQMSFGVLWKISNSLGEEKLIAINEEIQKEHKDSPAVKLIDIIVKLEYTKKFPKDEIRDLAKELGGINPYSFRLLQSVLIQHLYLHRSNHTERQWILDVLKIPMQTQVLIGEKKANKMDK